LGKPKSFKGIAEGVENSNFHLQTDRGAFILTLYEKRVREADLPYFLGLMEHLATHGTRCPLPVRRRDGGLWTTLNGRPAALLTYLDGLSLHRPDATHCAAAVAACARLHDAGRFTADLGGRESCFSFARAVVERCATPIARRFTARRRIGA
jgi:homoserine kinase type II